MRCRKVQRLLETYLDNDLNAFQQGRVEKHLATCERCTETLETTRQCHRVFREQPESPAPDNDFANRVVARAREQNLLKSRPPRRYLLWFWMTNNPGFRKAVAAGGLVVGLTAGLLITGASNGYATVPADMRQTAEPQQEITEETYGADYFTDRPQGSLPDALFSLVSVNNQRRE